VTVDNNDNDYDDPSPSSFIHVTIGDGVTHVVPVFDGFVPQNLIRRLDVAGRHVTQVLQLLLYLYSPGCLHMPILTMQCSVERINCNAHRLMMDFFGCFGCISDIKIYSTCSESSVPIGPDVTLCDYVLQYMIKLLMLRGYAFNSSADFDTVRQIKEKLCYVASDIHVERKLALETTCLMEAYTLPDGKVIRLGRERFEAPECLFNPSLGITPCSVLSVERIDGPMDCE